MWKPYDRVAFATNTTGDGAVAIGPALGPRFVAPSDLAIPNATAEIPYLIIDGNNFEIGFGTYDAGTFARDVVHLSKIGGVAGTDKISLTGQATVRFVASGAAFAAILAALEARPPGSGYTASVALTESEFAALDPPDPDTIYFHAADPEE